MECTSGESFRVSTKPGQSQSQSQIRSIRPLGYMFAGFPYLQVDDGPSGVPSRHGKDAATRAYIIQGTAKD
jgi:hypothetical protein